MGKKLIVLEYNQHERYGEGGISIITIREIMQSSCL